jgi:hypothetical protein
MAPITMRKKKEGLNNIKRYLVNSKIIIAQKDLEKICEETVVALKNATPKSSQITAESWGYEIQKPDNNTILIYFNNSNIQNGINVALLLDTGHGTRGGKWVSGANYIDKPIQESYEKILEKTKEALNK